MKQKIFMLCGILFFALIACEKENNAKNEPKKEETDSILGTWGNGQHADSSATYSRISNLVDDYSFSIEENGVFKERKNEGWCGTPPITYKTYTGTWSIEDSILTINTEYWGGLEVYKWKIKEVSKNKLVFQTAF